MTNPTNKTNPKKIEGDKKAPLDLIPFRVMKKVSWVMANGAKKYGRYNFRHSNIQASTYYASTMRHIGAWFDGEDLDPDTQYHHIDHAIAGLLVLRDAMMGCSYADDRPEKNDPTPRPLSGDDYASRAAQASFYRQDDIST